MATKSGYELTYVRGTGYRVRNMAGTHIGIVVPLGDGKGWMILGDDYILITAGNRYLAHTNAFGNGTHVLTVKVDEDQKSRG